MARISIGWLRELTALPLAISLMCMGKAGALAQTDSPIIQLPSPVSDPLNIDAANDPFIALSSEGADPQSLHAAIEKAVARAPLRLVARAEIDAADAGRDEARAAVFPTIDLNVIGSRSIARNFSNDPLNIVERSRGKGRLDAVASVNQLVLDFGATQRRIASARARIDAATADEAGTREQIALQAIAAHYRVFAYRLLFDLSQDNTNQLLAVLRDTEERIRQGVMARADTLRVEAAIAENEAQTARFLRAREDAELSYKSVIGEPPPLDLTRSLLPEFRFASEEAIRLAVADTAQVRAASAIARAARADARAAKADMFPRISVGVDAGQYGITRSSDDYDVRVTATVRQRIFGGLPQRSERLGASARAAELRAQAALEEQERNALSAWREDEGLSAELKARQQAYIAARKARDVQRERFRVSRGTLFEALDANAAFHGAAINLLSVMLERDTARYTLLARTGKLFPAMNITASTRSPGL